MKTKDFLETLALGELRNLSLIDKDDKTKIKDSEESMVINYTNQGLISLFSKFILLEKEILLITRHPYTKYHLRRQYAMSNVTHSGVKYIDDSNCDKFEQDVIKILNIYNEHGQEMFLNDIEQSTSIFTPQYDVVQIPNRYCNEIFSIVYQAKHRELKKEDKEVEIDIPSFFYEALQNYVAAKVLSHMNGEGNTAKANDYMSRYEYLCADAEAKDLATTSLSTTNSKLERRGFK